jgi:hypothetical protein
LTDRSTSNTESWTVLAFAMAASFAAIVWSWRHDAMLNYGDAVAHLHIARRVFDSRTPRLSLLGSVWLPLPHVLLIPFVQDYSWWATGLAGVIPSALSYVASCAGMYRLARHWVEPASAALALAFFALNPNLLYLQTTAMTEPLFLCELIWTVVWLVEWRDSLDRETSADVLRLRPIRAARNPRRRPILLLARRPLRIFDADSRQRGAWLRNPSAPSTPRANLALARSATLQFAIAAALVAAIFTRYDGWIIAFLAWTAIALTLLGRWFRGERGRLGAPSFTLSSLAIVAAPLLWFLYNAVCFGDWLNFARGPYSAKAIEMRTSVPGFPPHPGWHNPWVALLYYVKVSELDSAAAWANALLALAAMGTVAALVLAKSATRRRTLYFVLLFWLPVPFYTWSVAYGSVPIFFPAWWPYTFYNTRYGLELLPAIAMGLALAAHLVARFLHHLDFLRIAPQFPILLGFEKVLSAAVFVILFSLTGLNSVLLLRRNPIVYVEGTKNLQARLPYDETIPPLLQQLLQAVPHAPVLMNTSAYPEIVSLTGIPLRQTINESDLEIFRAALVSPATHAAIVVAFDGDPVDQAVRAHPAGLEIAGNFIAKDQPTATVYFATAWFDRSLEPKRP